MKDKQRRTPTGQLKRKRKPKSFKAVPDINGRGLVTQKVSDAQHKNRAKFRKRLEKGLVKLGKPLSHIAMENMFLSNSPTTQVTR